MGYIIAFLIFFMAISFLGFLFSILWPVILVLGIVLGWRVFVMYRKQKKMMNEFYNNQEETTFYEQDTSIHEHSDDVIDVEFSEEEIDK